MEHLDLWTSCSAGTPDPLRAACCSRGGRSTGLDCRSLGNRSLLGVGGSRPARRTLLPSSMYRCRCSWADAGALGRMLVAHSRCNTWERLSFPPNWHRISRSGWELEFCQPSRREVSMMCSPTSSERQGIQTRIAGNPFGTTHRTESCSPPGIGRFGVNERVEVRAQLATGYLPIGQRLDGPALIDRHLAVTRDHLADEARIHVNTVCQGLLRSHDFGCSFHWMGHLPAGVWLIWKNLSIC